MMIMKRLLILAIPFALLSFHGCDEGKVNFFTVDQDIQFGKQLDSAILADPVNYPILLSLIHI